MKIISRVGKTRLAGLWRSSKWMLAIIIPIIGAIQLAGLSTGQPVKAQPAAEQKRQRHSAAGSHPGNSKSWQCRRSVHDARRLREAEK